MGDPGDVKLRNVALEHVRELQRRERRPRPTPGVHLGLPVPWSPRELRVVYSGIFRPKQLEGPAALCLVTAPPKSARPAPYDDAIDDASGRLISLPRGQDRSVSRRLQVRIPGPPQQQRAKVAGRGSGSHWSLSAGPTAMAASEPARVALLHRAGQLERPAKFGVQTIERSGLVEIGASCAQRLLGRD